MPNANGWMTEVYVSIRLLQTDSENETNTILHTNMVNIKGDIRLAVDNIITNNTFKYNV